MNTELRLLERVVLARYCCKGSFKLPYPIPIRFNKLRCWSLTALLIPQREASRMQHELMAAGADVAFDACGVRDTFDAAISSVKTGGVIFNVAFSRKATSAKYEPSHSRGKEGYGRKRVHC